METCDMYIIESDCSIDVSRDDRASVLLHSLNNIIKAQPIGFRSCELHFALIIPYICVQVV